jgi:hypothetical protein
MKKNLVHGIISALRLSFVVFNSCKKETGDPVDIGMKYFPGNVGHWISYRVDSLVWDGFYYPDTAHPNYFKTYHYFIKEKVDSIYLDNQNRPTIILGRYKKDSANMNWYSIAAWAVNITPSTVEKVEENVRFIKMVFPVVENKKWNGNAFNTMDEQFYKYKNCFDPYIVGTHSFDSTITVVQHVDSIFVWAYKQTEVFAANVGMVYKRYRYIEYDPNGLIREGKDYTYYYESSGNY